MSGEIADRLVLTGYQVRAIYEALGGGDSTITIERFPARADAETGEPMPAGLYLYYTDYPEEGCIYLPEDEERAALAGSPGAGHE